MGTSELLCHKCIELYATRIVDIAPRTASTIYNGNALCWVHFATIKHLNDLLEIDTDDTVYPTGYSILRKQQQEEEEEKKEKKGEGKDKDVSNYQIDSEV